MSLQIVENGVSIYDVPAVSGRPKADGSFDYSVENQKNKNKGPIPAGNYVINPQAIQRQKFLDYIIGEASFFTQMVGIGKIGAWPGGAYSWGPMRVDIQSDLDDRSGFTIHGGISPGSAGCIDLTQNVVPFMLRFQLNSAGATSVPLIVQYPTK